ncbi:hypothetical protein [Niallia nealsonii]|uniref:Uncharacterized protein n=1 Tax=Niallia nealsonii TaxID=115979 RepID=A0A2N0Z310_9BACI|nr:hypothetical protein [Niallia nealsonii]PKG23892.1 hypothetical protein CWS01_08960 [Niallia nealsonii]
MNLMKKAQYFIGIIAMAFLLVQGVMDITNYFSSDSESQMATMEMGQMPSMGQNGDNTANDSGNTSGDTSTSSDSSTATDEETAGSDSDTQSQAQGRGQMTPPSGDFSGNGPQQGGSGFNSIHQGTSGLVTGIILVLLSGAGLVFTGMSVMSKRKEA